MRAIGPAVAGRWYPADPAALTDLVDRLLDQANKSVPDAAARPPRVIVAPHAGYAYSGQVAAEAFRPVMQSSALQRVVLIGPSHYLAFRGARVPFADAYRTPLGDVPLDRTALEHLLAHPCFCGDDDLWMREHSLEAELPFLQRTLGERFDAVPIVVGPHSTDTDLQLVAKQIVEIFDDQTLIVISSDFTHYGRLFGFVPFEDDVEERLRKLDDGAIEHIVAGDADGFARYCADTGATICGRLAIEVALRIPLGTSSGRLIDYDTSGRVTGDWSHSVSYAAIGFSCEGRA